MQLSAEEERVWEAVEALWRLAVARDAHGIRDKLHPSYAGWDMSASGPHDRDTAVASVTRDARVARYQLQPLSVRVYDGEVGVVHYRYAATVVREGGAAVPVAGGWTEVYLKRQGDWVMLAVSGRPDRPMLQTGEES
jgi:hypothetical protein